MTTEQTAGDYIDRSEWTKQVLMPPQQTMIRKLKEIRLLRDYPQTTDDFYSRLIDSLAGKKVNAAGLNGAWDLTKMDVMRNASPEMKVFFMELIDSYFAQAIKALTPPDSEVALVAILFRNEVAEQERKIQEAQGKI